MPTFIALANWTDQGIKNVKESPARLDAFKQAAQKLGCEVKGFYLVTGKYDMVLITEAPDGETVAKLSLLTGSQGAVRTETLSAFPEGAYREIIAALP
jgi:uncharacterized protein with GYD domain